MGILNVTPDSFFPGSRHDSIADAVGAALRMEQEGADILDIGAESTRPGSSYIDEELEISRLMPALHEICRHIHVPVSVDTRKGTVARMALDEGACIINDISSLCSDLSLIEIVKNYNCDIILMDMQERTSCNGDLSECIAAWLADRAGQIRNHGIVSDRMILDPGIGFGKDTDGNLSVLNHLDCLKARGYPVLVGCSRKRFIGHVTGRDVDSRLPGTLAAELVALQNGADILRVHDVSETVDLIRMYDAFSENLKRM